MAEQRRPPTDADLERALTDLGAYLTYPPTPELASTVARRVASPPAPRHLRMERGEDGLREGPLSIRRWRGGAGVRLAALAALLLLLLAASLVALFPGARAAVADRLGLPGISIFFSAAVPTATPSPIATATAVPVATSTPDLTATPVPVPTATPTPIGTGLRLGQRVSLADARGRVAFAILTPTAPELGPPDEVYVGQPPAGGQVALLYRARPTLPAAAETGVGLLLTEFRGDIAPEYFGKGLGPGSRLEQVTFNGQRGFWISGQPHMFFYTDASGNIHNEDIRLAGNTLLWERDGITFRLEADISKEAALRIAESVR